MVQTAEGAITEVQSICWGRMRENWRSRRPTPRSGRPTRGASNTEVTALRAEIKPASPLPPGSKGSSLLDGSMSGPAPFRWRPAAPCRWPQRSTPLRTGRHRGQPHRRQGFHDLCPFLHCGRRPRPHRAGGMSQPLASIGGVAAQGTRSYNFDSSCSITVASGSGPRVRRSWPVWPGPPALVVGIGRTARHQPCKRDVLSSTSLSASFPNSPVSYHPGSGGLDPAYPCGHT